MKEKLSSFLHFVFFPIAAIGFFASLTYAAFVAGWNLIDDFFEWLRSE